MYVKKNIPKSTFEFTCTSIFVNQHCSFTNLFVPTFAIGHSSQVLNLFNPVVDLTFFIELFAF